MTASRPKALGFLLDQLPLVLFVLVFAVFGWLSPRFLAGANFLNILVQASSTVILAIGMTFVLLTAGVDLSIGAIMSSPAVDKGVVYVGSMDGNLYALQ